VLFVILQSYTLSRRTFFQQPADEAFANALDLIRWQDALHFNFELDLQRWVLQHDWLVDVVNIYYGNFKLVLYVVAALACLVAPVGYRRVRRVFILTTLLAWPMYALFPLSPPRFMSVFGYPFIDTRTGHGDLPTAVEGFSQANLFAAMPSMHIGWTAVVAMWLAMTFPKHHLGAIIGSLHLTMMGFVVMATGNHWVFDIIAGLATTGLAWLIAALLPARLPWTDRWNAGLTALAARLRLPILRPHSTDCPPETVPPAWPGRAPHKVAS
jgi:hypothetical protein